MIFQSDKAGAKADFGFDKRVAKSGEAHHSLIAEDLKITGNLESTGDITVEGFVDGHIKCRSLNIGRVPNLTCSVEAETVRIDGAFYGDVRATKVILTKSARVTGDIYHESLEVEEGAKLEGRLSRLKSDSKPAGGDDKVTHFKPVESKSADPENKAAKDDPAKPGTSNDSGSKGSK